MKKKGISLITLIITIVVIIILAAAVILAISNNNPIANAKKARDMSDEATREEELKIKQLSSILLPAWSGNTATGFASGTGIESDPYLISSGEELAYFAKLVNEGNYTICGKLTKSINMGNKEFPMIADSNVIGAEQDGSSITKKYNGTFDGDSNVITGISINKPENCYVGIFGALGENGVIKNLNLYQGSILSKVMAGGIVGFSEGIIDSCTNAMNVETTNGSTGGMTSKCKNGKIINCINYGNIVNMRTDVFTGSYAPHAGGIVAIFDSNDNDLLIDNCKNYGNVYSKRYPVGGIIGTDHQSTGKTIIRNCKNSGKIVSGMQQAGGIAGRLSVGEVRNCYNTGEVVSNEDYSSTGMSGGIIGSMGNDVIVSNVYNSGKIMTYDAVQKLDRAGGIIGLQKGGTIEKAYNRGEVVGEILEADDEAEILGGIVATQTGGTIVKTYYYGDLLNLVGSNSSSAISGTITENQTGVVEKVTDDIATYEEFLEWIKTK